MKRNPDKHYVEKAAQHHNKIWGILSRTKSLVENLLDKNLHSKEIIELNETISMLEKEIILSQRENLIKYKLVFDHINT
jgi:hypothetical protein